MEQTLSKDFWNRKARENALWYVSSYGSYARRDENEFWQSGQTIWNEIKVAIGYSPALCHTVVEIGCGVGRLTRAISPEVGTVFAQDISEEMLKIAEAQHLTNVTCMSTNGSDLASVKSCCADLVLAYCVFQHLPSLSVLGQYLQDMVRVAKPDATVAFTITPWTWRSALLPLLRSRRRVLDFFTDSGPKELWRREWVGIRPSMQKVLALSPLPLKVKNLGGGRTLFWGQVPGMKE